MKVKRMIEKLQQMQRSNPDAEVKLHHRNGNNALFILAFVGDDKTIVIEDKDDNDLSNELEVRFKEACDNQVDELDFYTDLIEMGFTLEDIKENLPEKYEHSKSFCEEHGLI